MTFDVEKIGALLTAPWRVLAMVVGTADRILMRGEPGVGKSTLAITAALTRSGNPTVVTLSEYTAAADLLGHYVPDGPGSFRWHNGPVARCMLEGGTLVLNEIDHAGPDALDILHAVLDRGQSAQLTLANDEVLKPAPGFCVIATMNSELDALRPAIADRFQVKIDVGSHVNPSLEAALDPVLLKAVRGTRISVRQAFAYQDLTAAGCDPDAALVAAFGEAATGLADALMLGKAPKASGI